jgi:hypothetical protein
MAFQHHKSFFVQEEIEALQRAFDSACLALGLERNDLGRRERLGAVIFEIARTGRCREAAVADLAVRRFRDPAMSRSPRMAPPADALRVRR